MKLLRLTTLLSLSLILCLSSCQDDKDDTQENIGSLRLSFHLNSPSGRIKSETPTALLVSIENEAGELIKELEELTLYELNGSYTSKPISLVEANYNIVEYMVLNDVNEVIYISPKEGSEYAYLVDEPLPLGFSIEKDNLTTLSPEVVAVEDKTFEDFGYLSFKLNVVSTFDFLISVFTYDDDQQEYMPATAHLSVSANGEEVYQQDLETGTNAITLREETGDAYQLTISKSGYSDFQVSYSQSQLESFYSSEEQGPLMISLEKTGDHQTLLLKPGSDVGKDAMVWSYDPVGQYDRGTDRGDMGAYEWTKNGAPTTKYGLIDFDLSALPTGAVITKAVLKLYHDPLKPKEGHSQLSGSNEMMVQRIITPWEEPVHWGIRPSTTTANEIEVAASTSSTQDYIIDITALMIDHYNDLDNSHGFLFKMKSEQYYRSVVFATSDHSDPALYPELILTYFLSK